MAAVEIIGFFVAIALGFGILYFVAWVLSFFQKPTESSDEYWKRTAAERRKAELEKERQYRERRRQERQARIDSSEVREDGYLIKNREWHFPKAPGDDGYCSNPGIHLIDEPVNCNCYRSKHPSRMPKEKAVLRSEKRVCLVHENYDYRNDYDVSTSCRQCNDEFQEFKQGAQPLPAPYQEYLEEIKFMEWFYLKTQDKCVQQGWLTEEEARENKYDFLENFALPIWKKRREKRKRDDEEFKRTSHLRGPAKPIW